MRRIPGQTVARVVATVLVVACWVLAGFWAGLFLPEKGVGRRIIIAFLVAAVIATFYVLYKLAPAKQKTERADSKGSARIRS